MFYYIKGIVTYKANNFMCLDCGGVGYKIYTSLTTLSAAEMKKEFLVYTYTHIREDAFDIYGFATNEELNTFEMLISVSGVGPKAALAILSFMPTDKFAVAVIQGDVKAITGAPGVGKKIAERIILELKDKISKELGESDMGAVSIFSEDSHIGEEAVNALMVLGYSALEAKGAVAAVQDKADNVEGLIKLALKLLMN